jgi:hypothetical protein
MKTVEAKNRAQAKKQCPEAIWHGERNVMPDAIPNHAEFIRIRNLEDSKTEVLEGIGVGTSSANGGGGIPSAPVAQKAAIDLKATWAAQQKLTATLVNFLSSLDPGLNTDFSNILTDYIRLLDSELPIIWKTIDREPSKEMVKFINDGATLGDDLEAWYKIFVKVGWGYYACFVSDLEYQTWKKQK